MEAIKYHPGILSEGGKEYTFPQPNFKSIERLFGEFRECMIASLKPVGMTMDSCSTYPQWVFDEVDTFDLTQLKEITFTIKLIRSKESRGGKHGLP